MEEYFKILNKIQEKGLDITKLYLLSCFDLHDMQLATEKMNYAYDLWIEADIDLDLARLADIIEENWEDIQNDKMSDEDVIEECIDI